MWVNVVRRAVPLSELLETEKQRTLVLLHLKTLISQIKVTIILTAVSFYLRRLLWSAIEKMVFALNRMSILSQLNWMVIAACELYFDQAGWRYVGKRRQPPEALETLKPLRRSARLRERKLNQETPYINRALRPPLQPAKICANRKPKQLQPKRQNIKRQKGSWISSYDG